MAITPTNSAASAAKPERVPGAAASADFNMFLKLLTTQMQNQDPLDPMDTSEYTQQLVQYSQVEQSMQQTGLLKDLLARLSSSDMADASGLIGREVQFDSAVGGLGERSAAWSWSLPRSASSLTAEIVDSSGRAVATRTLEPGSSSGRFEWDGLLANGSRAPEGAYVLKLKASDGSGAAMTPAIRSIGMVDEVMQSDGELWLGIGGVSLPISELKRVTAA